MEPVTEYITNFYKNGFFGYGPEGDFKYGSLAHIVPIVIAIGIIIFIFINKEKIRNSKYENTIRMIIGFISLLAEFSFYWRMLYCGNTKVTRNDLLTYLPIQVCQWSCILSSLMMFNKNKKLYQYCVYVCLTLGLIPLITPVVISTTGVKYFRYYQFWLEHLVPIISVFYMSFVHNYKPTKKGMIRAYIYLIILSVIAIIANNIFVGSDYLYLIKNESFAKSLPKNQTIRAAIVAVGICPLFFTIYYLFKDKNIKKY